MPLTVTNLDNTVGPAEGGQDVVITGTLFAASVRVRFGDAKATAVVRANATTIRCKTPAQTVAGLVNVTVTNDPGYMWNGGPTAAWVNQYLVLPQIDTITPAELPPQGGVQVTLEGKGFPVGARVEIRAAGAAHMATNVVRVSATQITCQPPQHPAGAAQVCVLMPAPEGRAYAKVISYCEPLISSLTPAKGRPTGNTAVTIRGKYFAPNAQVHFDGALAAAVVFVNDTELTATTAAHVAGLVDVRVTFPGAAAVVGVNPAPLVPLTATTMNNAFEFADSSATSIEPKQGPAAGGTNVTIKGRGLLALAVNGVQIGGVAAINVNLVDEQTITATTAAAPAGPGNVSVQNNLGDPAAILANGFTFVAAATVTSTKPAEGPEGTTVVVVGTHFEKGATVRIGGQAATNVEVVSPTAIRCTAPAHANGAVDVDVENPGCAAGNLNNGFTYVDFRIEPERGLPAGGENITIHLPAVPVPAPAVTFAGLAAAHVGGGAFVVTTPVHAVGQINVAVGADTRANAFEYATITKIEPNAGPAGTTVTIHGAGFDGTTTVTIGGNPAAPVIVAGPNSISVATPPHAPGATNVVVANAGAGNFPGGYTYQPAATITGIEPATGTAVGGTVITFTGTGFVDGAGAFIAGVAATNVVVVSPTTITATTPAALGVAPFAAVAVSVLNPGALAIANGGNLWTYRNAPAVTVVASPAVGPIGGGRSITVTGTDFVDGAKVVVDGSEATEVEFVNATTLRCRVPAHAAGAVGIAVHNPDDPAPGAARVASFTFVADPSTPTGQNHVVFLRDGEAYFEALRRGFELIRQSPPDPNGLTYVRLAYWDVNEDFTVGDRNFHKKANHRLLEYVEQVARAGHNVEVILWRPRPSMYEHKVSEGKHVYESNRPTADKLYAIDVALAGVAGAARVRVYFEHSEGPLGASLHQKIAIFCVAGLRHAFIGGLNLSNGYFAAQDHSVPALAAQCRPWHDAAIYVRGPATDDIEKEWMRRWMRTRTLEAEWFGLANVVGRSGEFLARDFSFFSSSVVRQREIATVDNNKHQPIEVQNTSLTIATTRSVGDDYQTGIRDKVIDRINAANNYIYFENYHFSDPDLVQAIVARHALVSAGGADLRVAIVVPHPMGGDSSYMTRRAWLHFALNFVNGATGNPYCTRVVYDIGGGPQTVLRAACVAWNVVDTYAPHDPTPTSWLEGDQLVFDTGAGPVTVPFHQIIGVEADIHFYCPKYVHGGGQFNTLYTHSKIAAFDDQFLVVGSANWSFRSMRYDLEISGIIDSGPITTNAVAGLLGHYNTGIAAPTPANVEARAVANAGAVAAGHIRLYPYEYLAPLAANPVLTFQRAVPPPADLSQGWASLQRTPNYTWL